MTVLAQMLPYQTGKPGQERIGLIVEDSPPSRPGSALGKACKPSRISWTEMKTSWTRSVND